MGVREKHAQMVDKFQKKIPKECLITFPISIENNTNLAGKRFKINQISSGGISEESLKDLDNNYKSDAVAITILYNIINETRDLTDSIDAPTKDYKQNNAIVNFEAKNYRVLDERANPLGTTITLFCDSVG